MTLTLGTALIVADMPAVASLAFRDSGQLGLGMSAEITPEPGLQAPVLFLLPSGPSIAFPWGHTAPEPRWVREPLTGRAMGWPPSHGPIP